MSASNDSRPPNCLPTEGFVRIRQIISPHGPIPVSRSAWWAGVRRGEYPPPVRSGRRVTAWKVDDIRALVRRLSQ